MNKTHIGDCRALLQEMIADDVKAQTCVTSPPYFGLRDYGMADQIGLEPDPLQYVAQLVAVFDLVRELLQLDGTLWLNLGDSYAGGGGFSAGAPSSSESKSGKYGTTGGLKAGGIKPQNGVKAKDLLGIPWLVAFALRNNGWYLRSDIIWHKPNPMPESVTDRPTKAHEYLFLLSKQPTYYYDAGAINEEAISGSDLGLLRGRSFEDGDNVSAHAPSIKARQEAGVDSKMAGDGRRNRRSVWTVTTQPFTGAHFATFPRALIEPCIIAGARPGDTVLDPFMGSGTTAQVATDLGRNFIGCELNPAYVALHEMRRTTIGMPI